MTNEAVVDSMIFDMVQKLSNKDKLYALDFQDDLLYILNFWLTKKAHNPHTVYLETQNMCNRILYALKAKGVLLNFVEYRIIYTDNECTLCVGNEQTMHWLETDVMRQEDLKTLKYIMQYPLQYSNFDCKTDFNVIMDDFLKELDHIQIKKLLDIKLDKNIRRG
jgi:hypothetical protein